MLKIVLDNINFPLVWVTTALRTPFYVYVWGKSETAYK